MLDWLEAHAPPWVVALYAWPGYRLFGRCLAQGCGRLMIKHSPWRRFVCERTPIAVEITEKGYEALAESAPVSRATFVA